MYNNKSDLSNNECQNDGLLKVFEEKNHLLNIENFSILGKRIEKLQNTAKIY